MKSLNINDMIKVKLNEVGLAIYVNRAKETNKKFEENNIKHKCPIFPKRDNKGFVKFQLWELMNLYGKHLELAFIKINAIIGKYAEKIGIPNRDEAAVEKKTE